MPSTSPILPGRTLGILGGGQLGRMTALAARRMGYRVHTLEPTPDAPAGQVCDVQIQAAYDDLEAARRFARGVDRITFEFENVPAETLAALESICPVHPSPFVLDTCRHRLREKRFLSDSGFPVAEFRAIRSAEELRATDLPAPAILKSADFGYDGKGQVRLTDYSDAPAAWRTVNRPLCVLEKLIPFDFEISTIVARSVSGQTRCYAPGRNVHVNGILDVTTLPAEIAPALERQAIDLATAIAEKLGVVGLLAVEMFVVGDRLLVNELAPRPHNSGHHTFDACLTSQFEQHVRAVCGLPLGDPALLAPVAMANLLGDLWSGGEPTWARALADPRVKLHLYGKHQAKPGRKMGHLCALADSVEEARRIVLDARAALVS